MRVRIIKTWTADVVEVSHGQTVVFGIFQGNLVRFFEAESGISPKVDADLALNVLPYAANGDDPGYDRISVGTVASVEVCTRPSAMPVEAQMAVAFAKRQEIRRVRRLAARAAMSS